MSATQRTIGIPIGNVSSQDMQKDNKNSTQHLEKILLSSSSTSSQRKIGGSTDLKQIILNTNDGNSNGQATQRTANNQMFNNTSRNWRKLITPAQDSLNKLQQQQPEYSGYNPGSRLNTQNEKPNAITSNNTSMDTSNLSMSVKQFTPSQDIQQLKMTLRANINTTSSQLESQEKSTISQYLANGNNITNINNKFNNKNLETVPDEETKDIKSNLLENFGASTSQMKSLMKSFSNGNFEFFDNLHKKYFEKAKDKSQKSLKPPTNNSQINLDKSEKDLFTLTSKTNTLLGISQFKNSIDSFKKSQDKPSVLRASSLNDNRNIQKNTMSINFKNSLYKKINPSTALLDDNSQSQIHPDKSKILHDRSLQRKVMQSYQLDSSDESLQADDFNHEESKQELNIQSHIKKNQQQILENKIAYRNNLLTKDSLEEAIFKHDFNALSRRDLSARHDDNTPLSNDTSPLSLSKERKNKFHRQNQIEQVDNKKNKNPIFDSQNSLNIFHQLLSSGNNLAQAKITSSQSSVMLSHPDFNVQSQYRDNTQIIFEQPTKEDALEDTYKNIKTLNQEIKPGEDLKAEDLTSMIEQAYMQSSQQSQNDILNTYKQHVQMARKKIINDDQPLQKKNVNTHKNSNNIPMGNKSNQQQSACQEKRFIGQNSNFKDMGVNIEQKSDFTFVLSNPTDFQCEYCGLDNNNSFVTQKFQKPIQTAQNSEAKPQQNFSSYRKGNVQTAVQPNRIQDFPASPIYSESGNLPNNQINIPSQPCLNCKAKKKNNVQHRLSYNQYNNQSIKEESNDEDDEIYYKDFNDKQQVFENAYEINTQKNNIISGETSLEEKQAPIEELKKLYTIVSFSQECMSKVLQDESVSQNVKGYLARVLDAISSVYSVNTVLPQLKQLNSTPQQQVTQTYSNMNNNNNNNHWISQQTTINHPSTLQDNNMTMSELHQIQQQQKQQQQFSNYNLNTQIRQKVLQGQNIIREEISTQQDESIYSEINHPPNSEEQKISSLYQQNIYENKNHQNNLKRKYQNLKSSLMSSQGSLNGNNNQNSNFNQFKEETVLSYFEQEEDIDEEEDVFDDESQQTEEQRLKIQNKQQMNTLRQSEFQENRFTIGVGRKSNFLRQSQSNNIFKVSEIKKSLKKTKKSLIKTKQQLKKERILNLKQEEKMKKLEAQIEALTERWKITEENIKGRDNMIMLMQRINSSTVSSNNHVVSQQNTNNTSFKMTATQQSQSSYIKPDQSPIMLSQNTISKSQQSHNNYIGSSQNSQSVNNLPSSFQHNISQGTPINPNVLTSTALTNNMNSNNKNNISQQQQSQLDQSSKHLLEINDRLTKQIEDNLVLFENLNNELTIKDKAIADNQAVLFEKEKEVERLMRKINEMSDNMKQLIEITKATTEATEQSKIKHQEEMEKIKRRQDDYQKKIDNLNKVFASNTPSDKSILNHSSSEVKIYSKYMRKNSQVNNIAASTAVLNCIPLTSPDSVNCNMPTAQSNNSSRVHDDEFSIGQIRSKQTNDNDIIPIKLIQQRIISENKENIQKNEDLSLLNSNVLKSLFNNLKESDKNYQNFQHQPSSFINNTNTNTNESTLLKYSQDATQSLQNIGFQGSQSYQKNLNDI